MILCHIHDIALIKNKWQAKITVFTTVSFEFLVTIDALFLSAASSFALKIHRN